MAGRVYAEGYGCPSNDYDLQLILSHFEAKGYVRVQRPDEADVIVVNTCAVKKRTEDRILSRLRVFEKAGTRLIVAGCLPLVNPGAVIKAAPNYAAILAPSSIQSIDDIIEHGYEKRGMRLTVDTNEPKIGKVTANKGPVISLLPVSEGCLGECAFCCTRLARGRLHSCPPESVSRAISLGITRGFKEFWLTGQDVGAYGRDIDCDLPSLLTQICSNVGDFRIRVGMMNPEWCTNRIEELILAFGDPRVFKFLHIPLQSGNDEVLGAMRRRYRVKDFLEVVEAFRKASPEVTVWTDIISGYPTEDEDAFSDTLSVLQRLRPDTVNVSRFSSRPGTQARALKPLPSETVKERSRRASFLSEKLSLSRNEAWLGWAGEVLVDEVGRNGTLIGRTDSYKPVVLHGPSEMLGQRVAVRVLGAQPTHLVGECTDSVYL
jgi:threonylcarbamoyladenosine tRNA methylthiotransferase CDKAL1